MKIDEFIIHRIDKEPRAKPFVCLRTEPLSTADPRVQKFTELAVEFFQVSVEKPTGIYAEFNEDQVTYPFSAWAMDYFAGQTPFLQFTGDSTNRLASRMQAQALATGGHVVFAALRGEDNARRLLVVMLHSQAGLSITPELEFADVSHLELRHIDKAALVEGPVNGSFGEQPLSYAGFRKEMSNYFQAFLGPDEIRHVGRDTKHLRKVIEDYAKEHSFDAARLDEVRMQLRAYAAERVEERTLELPAVSAIVDPTAPRRFAVYAAKQRVSAVLRHDPQVFNGWKIVRHKSADGLLIQFKAETVAVPGVVEGRLKFDEKRRTLTITRLEDGLVNKIKRARGL